MVHCWELKASRNELLSPSITSVGPMVFAYIHHRSCMYRGCRIIEWSVSAANPQCTNMQSPKPNGPLTTSPLPCLTDMANIVALLLIIMFIFSIIGLSLFGDSCPRHFGTLGKSKRSGHQLPIIIIGWTILPCRHVLSLCLCDSGWLDGHHWRATSSGV